MKEKEKKMLIKVELNNRQSDNKQVKKEQKLN